MLERLKGRLKAMANPSKRTFRIVLASVCLMALVWQHIQATRLGYQVEAARKQAQQLRGRIGAIELELQTRLSPAQLAAQARGRLNMQPASPECLRLLGEAAGSEAGHSFFSRLLARAF